MTHKLNNDVNNNNNKYTSLRPKKKAFSSDQDVALTFQDLAQFSQRTMENVDPYTRQHLSGDAKNLTSLLYNSCLNVQSINKALRHQNGLDKKQVHTNLKEGEFKDKINTDGEFCNAKGGVYVNYCDKNTTEYVEKWLCSVNDVQSREGAWPNVIDNSLKILPFLMKKG